MRYLHWWVYGNIIAAAQRFNVLPVITAAPALFRRQDDPGVDSPSCSGFYSLVNSCAAKTIGFTGLALTAQLDCVCSTSSTWAGTLYDGYWSSCLGYISTASPAVWSLIHGVSITLLTPCQAFAPSATRAVGDCGQWLSTAASCYVASPSLSTLPLTDQAGCLCYSGSVWNPDVMDRDWVACLSVYKTFRPSFYSSIGGDHANPTPCEKAGNVRNAATATPAPTTSGGASNTGPLTTSEPSQTNANPNSATVSAVRDLGWTLIVAIGLGVFLMERGIG